MLNSLVVSEISSLFANTTALVESRPIAAPKNQSDEQKAVQEIRLGDSRVTAFVYLHKSGFPQLTLVVSELTFKKLSAKVTPESTSNRDLISLLKVIEPELVNHLTARIRSAFNYPILKAIDSERGKIQRAARQLRALLDPRPASAPVNFAVEVATPNFTESFTVTKTDCKTITKLQAELESLRINYEKRRAINTELPTIDFTRVDAAIKTAFSAAASDRALKSIAKDLMIPHHSVCKWFAGQLVLPEELTGTKVSVKKCFKYLVDLSRLTTKEQAFLVGAYLARSAGRAKIGTTIEFTLGEKTTRKLSEIVSKTLTSGLKPTTLTKGSSYVCRVSSVHFIERMEELTEKGTRIPWQILPTVEERKEFLRGYCTRSHIASTVGIGFYRYGKEEFLAELAVLLSRFGIVPRLMGSPLHLLAIEDKNSLQRFKELQVFSETADIETLDEISKRSGNVSSYSYEDYLAALSHNTPAGLTLTRPKTIKQWREQGIKPKAVTRKERLDAAVAFYKIPDPDTQAYLVSSVGIDPKVARPVAYQMKLADLVNRVERLALCKLNPAHNIQALLVPRVVFEEVLKFYERKMSGIPESKLPITDYYPPKVADQRTELVHKYAAKRGIVGTNQEILRSLAQELLLPKCSIAV